MFVDFYADWCGPCRTLAPVLQAAVKDNGKAILLKVDIDQAPSMGQKYQISSLPTVHAFRDGKSVASFIGSQRPDVVKAFIEENA